MSGWSAAQPTGGYASKAEAKMAARLALLQSALVVSTWDYVADMPGYALRVDGRLVGRYRPDFWVHLATGELIVVEVKGRISRDWPLRRRLAEACYPLLTLHVVSSDDVDAYDPREWPPKRPRAKRLSLAGAER